MVGGGSVPAAMVMPSFSMVEKYLRGAKEYDLVPLKLCYKNLLTHAENVLKS